MRLLPRVVTSFSPRPFGVLSNAFGGVLNEAFDAAFNVLCRTLQRGFSFFYRWHCLLIQNAEQSTY